TNWYAPPPKLVQSVPPPPVSTNWTTSFGPGRVVAGSPLTRQLDATVASVPSCGDHTWESGTSRSSNPSSRGRNRGACRTRVVTGRANVRASRRRLDRSMALLRAGPGEVSDEVSGDVLGPIPGPPPVVPPPQNVTSPYSENRGK